MASGRKLTCASSGPACARLAALRLVAIACRLASPPSAASCPATLRARRGSLSCAACAPSAT